MAYRNRSGPTAMHFTVVALSVATLVLLAMAFSFHREGVEHRAGLVRVKEELDKQKLQVRTLDDRIQTLKEIIGYTYSQVGQIDEEDQATVIGAVRADLRRSGGKTTLKEAIASLLVERDSLLHERDQLVTSKSTLMADYRMLQRIWTSLMEPERAARERAERSLRTNIVAREEVLKSKDREIETLRSLAADQRTAITELQETLETKDKDYQQKVALHRSTVRRLNRVVQQREAHRFERTDGKLTLVERGQKLAWINLGSLDGLRPGIRFSVFDRDAGEVGGSRKGLKGVIQIVRVTGGHRAQATILEDNIKDPILPGDLVFSPIWSPGQREQFALVGSVDLNRDGRSDIEGLRRHVEESGASVPVWVDAAGRRNGGAINMNIKYLVIGMLPSAASARTDAEKEAYNRLVGHLAAMREEAYDNGVRVIRLNDFLAYIGYKPGLGTGVSVTNEPRPPNYVKPPGTKPRRSGKSSPLAPPRRPPATKKGTSGRFRRPDSSPDR